MSDRRELFVEIGSEELPAKEVLVALEFVKDAIVTGLDEAHLAHGAPRTFATPRRLVVVVPEVEAKQADRTSEVAGPPVKVAFQDGKPTKAAEGFAKGLGLEVSDLKKKSTPKGEYLVAEVAEKGRAASAILLELLPAAIAKIPFKRTMRWGDGDATFARPLQWIVAVFGGEVLRFRYGDVESGRTSRGHRFLAPEPFEVHSAAQYLEAIRQRQVVVDVAERRQMIIEGSSHLAATLGAWIRPDDALIDEIVQLVEYPVPLLGAFEASFLEIPQAVLISEMREHQRYLSVVDGKGKLLPHFVVIANTAVEDPKVTLDGYRRVLSARFQDGRFFFSEDQKVALGDRIDRLKGVAFHRALGTSYEKVERVVKIAFWLAGALGEQLGVPGLRGVTAPSDLRRLADAKAPKGDAAELFKWQLARAGYLMKADLTTAMVFEFPELQGVMGRAYAERAGEPAEVAAAIEAHYLPRHAGDELPAAPLGALLGMADRLDTIVGIFATGKGPTGAADPFGLRRAALGVINVLRAKGWHFSLEAAITEALERVEPKRKKDRAEVMQEIREFFRGRLKGVITSGEISPDVAEAVLVAGDDDVVDVGLRAEALARLKGSSDFEPVAIAFKRVANILKDQRPGELEPTLLKTDAERALLRTAEDAAGRVREAVGRRDFGAAFAVIAEIRPAVDRFFEAVLVMDPDPAIRAQRVALVARVHRIFAPLADFTRLSS
ncbi:MAG: glycine--tRNA ligase subunit beta [Deltaproteobacteria bacterium]|nr:glycine--tRNA ligase subunit beta [Deltaproteobacteria bacterium]